MQPIHYAAVSGDTELMTILIDKFEVDLREKADVNNDIFMLTSIVLIFHRKK